VGIRWVNVMAASGLIRTGWVLFGDADNPIDGVSDVKVAETAEGVFLSVGSEAMSAVSVFDVSEPGVVTLTSRIDYSAESGTQVLTGIVFAETAFGMEMLTLGRYDDNIGSYLFNDDGTLGVGVPLTFGSGSVSGAWVAETAVVRGVTYAYVAEFGTPGFTVVTLDGGGAADVQSQVEDQGNSFLGDVSVMRHAEIHGVDVLLTGSAFDAGMHLFLVRPNGNLLYRDNISAQDAGGIARITDIEVAEVGARTFAVVASSQSDTLTVLRISDTLNMKPIDQTRDTRELRLEGVQAVEVFEANGRVFVVAGGGDDGISLFEMDYRGQLVHLETVADGFDTTLRNISSIEVRVEGEEAHVYVGSASEHGVTELIIDLSRTGEVTMGGAVVDVITGTADDDVIWGRGKSDVLDGGAGDDRLIDGRGKDTLTGGEGEDVFVFIDDGRSDFITDFEIGTDKIDLTDFDYVNHIDDLVIGTREGGAVIIVGDEVIRLVDPNDQPIDVSGITADSFIFG